MMFSRFNRNMNSKADTNIYLLIIVLLAVLVCYLQPKLIFPALILFGVIYYFSRQNLINREIFLAVIWIILSAILNVPIILRCASWM